MKDKQLPRKINNSETLWILFFLTPALVVVVVIIVVPLFLSLFNSLYDWEGLSRGKFLFLKNFVTIFTQYPYQARFFNAFANNIKWFAVTMVVQNTIGLFFGYIFSRGIGGSSFYRRVFFLPVLFSIVAVGFLWNLYLSPRGLLNYTLAAVGLDSLASAWLGDERLATYTIIAVNMWRWVGFPTLVFMTAIDNVPAECIEAALLEGVRERSLFMRIIFPMIVPAITIITVLTLIGSINVFEQVYTMGGLEGGPNYSTDTLGTLFYRTAFGSVDSGIPEVGTGSAIGVVIYILTFVFSLGTIAGLRKKEVLL